MAQLRVVSAVADRKKATLYLEDGKVEIVDQRDPRLVEIMNQIIPIIAKGEVAVIELSSLSVFADYQKTSSVVRFFKVAKSKIKHIFGMDETVEEKSDASPTTLKEALNQTFIKEQREAAANQLMEELKTAEALETDTVHADETIVAVTADNKVIPHMEKLKDYFVHSKLSKNTVGMENFLKRVSTMIDKYGHSVEDILRFMEKGDLPVANDGSIIAYKILKKTNEEGVFVDCHSGKVKQKVGSFVVVDPSMVDRNRRNECSNGLHIARRGYLGNFPGDVCVLIKLAPEDVVTVPHNDPNKVRVCGYHILSVLPPESFAKLKHNTPMTDNPEAARQLENALTGKHVGKLEEVRITQPNGGGLVIKPLNQKASVASAAPVKAVALDGEGAAFVSPKNLAKKMSEEEEKVSKAAVEAADKAVKTVVEESKPAVASEPAKDQKADEFFATKKPTSNVYADLWAKAQAGDANAAQELLDRKKRAKKSWAALGLPDDVPAQIEKLKSAQAPVAKKKTEPKEKKPVAVKPKAVTPAAPSLEGKSNKEKVRVLYNHWIVTLEESDKAALFAVKKTAKVSWTKLGLTDAEISQLEK